VSYYGDNGRRTRQGCIPVKAQVCQTRGHVIWSWGGGKWWNLSWGGLVRLLKALLEERFGLLSWKQGFRGIGVFGAGRRKEVLYSPIEIKGEKGGFSYKRDSKSGGDISKVLKSRVKL